MAAAFRGPAADATDGLEPTQIVTARLLQSSGPRWARTFKGPGDLQSVSRVGRQGQRKPLGPGFLRGLRLAGGCCWGL